MPFKNVTKPLVGLHLALAVFAATAEPKEHIYGKDQSTPYEAGWPLRVNPSHRPAVF